MKKQQRNDKLAVRKETVRVLGGEAMAQVAGGSLWTSNPRIGSGGVITTIDEGSGGGGGGGCVGTLMP